MFFLKVGDVLSIFAHVDPETECCVYSDIGASVLQRVALYHGGYMRPLNGARGIEHISRQFIGFGNPKAFGPIDESKLLVDLTVNYCEETESQSGSNQKSGLKASDLISALADIDPETDCCVFTDVGTSILQHVALYRGGYMRPLSGARAIAHVHGQFVGLGNPNVLGELDDSELLVNLVVNPQNKHRDPSLNAKQVLASLQNETSNDGSQNLVLRHVEDFRNFILLSQASVQAVFARLFEEVVPEFDECGKILPTKVDCWEQFSNDIAHFTNSTGLESIRTGKRIIQWCALGVNVARFEENPVCDTRDFAVVDYIARDGRKSLFVSDDVWNAHLEWKRQFELHWKSQAAGLAGPEDPGPAPQVNVEYVSIPHLGHYVRHRSDDRNLLARIIEKCSLPDLIVSNGDAFLTSGCLSYRMRLDEDYGLLQLFALHEKRLGEASEASFRTNFGSQEFFVRAQFHSEQHSFRCRMVSTCES